MKCENCGGNLSLEDLNCPYCGTVNKHAQQHVRDMKRYHGEFQETKKDVYATATKYTGITVRAIMIAVLLILTVVLAIVGAESYSFRRILLEKRAEKNFAEYCAVMDQYLEKEDYMAFHAFVEANSIGGYDTDYEKYIPIMRASSQYTYLYDNILGVYTNTLKENEDSMASDRVKYLSEQLNYFYDSLDMENYEYIENYDSLQNRNALAQMEQNVKALLQTYCGLTKEDVDGLGEMSEARRMVLLEERIEYAK